MLTQFKAPKTQDLAGFRYPAFLIVICTLLWCLNHFAASPPHFGVPLDVREAYLTHAAPLLKKAHFAALVGVLLIPVVYFVFGIPKEGATAWLVGFFTFAFAIFLFMLYAQASNSRSSLMLFRDVRVEFDAHAGTIRLDGTFPSTLENLLSDLPSGVDWSMLKLGTNRGGDVSSVFFLLDAGLPSIGIDSVVIDGQCESSCAYLAVLMPNRYLARGGKLGFHDLHSPLGPTRQVKADREELIRRMVKDKNIDQAVAVELFRTPDIRISSTENLVKHKLIDACVNDELEEIPCDF